MPNETLIFEAGGHFQFFRDGRLTNEGTYNTSQGEVCSGAPSQPLLRFAVTPTTSSYLPVGGSYTLQGNTLVIDQGTHCVADVPVSTYERQP
ncbi:MAG: hypothetical protein EOO62_34790 [Hymenobacter sp.]|nr:MAG: hypothetical protein EOO62_34790 [Hymenobacter sp.]